MKFLVNPFVLPVIEGAAYVVSCCFLAHVSLIDTCARKQLFFISLSCLVEVVYYLKHVSFGI